jgi:AraC family transcriptional regulator
MLKKQSLTINFTHESTSLQLFSCAPLLSSSRVSWNDIRLEYHQQPAQEAPEHFPAQHILMVNHQFLPLVERKLNEQFQRDRVMSGDIAIVPANVLHKARWNDPAEFTLLILEPSFVTRIAHESIDLEEVEILPHFAARDPLIYQIARSLKSELESCGTMSRLYAESAAAMLAFHLLQHYSSSQKVIEEYTGGLTNSQLQHAIDYIHTHLEQNLGLVELADLVQISPDHFRKLFKQSTGQTPYKYLLECRLDKVKKLLASADLSIGEIAERTGFNSHSHLTRVFRQHLSITPKEYRQAKR